MGPRSFGIPIFLCHALCGFCLPLAVDPRSASSGLDRIASNKAKKSEI
jgi:hypothetical protein